MMSREIKFQDLNAAIHYVHRLRQIGYIQRGSWDLGQICVHLTAAMLYSMERRTIEAPPFLMRMIGPLILKPLVLRRRKLRAGVKAPRELTPPRSVIEAKAVSDFVRTIDQFRSYQGPPNAHPVFGALTAAEWHTFHTIHAAHHLGFLTPK